MFRSSVEFFKSRQGKIVGNKTKAKGCSGLLSTIIFHQQNRLRALEKNFKEEFFFNTSFKKNSNTSLRKIPNKTWNRYSAFLTYQQQIHNRLTENEQLSNELIQSSSNVLTADEGRISIRVKSIKSLPIWATSLNELSLIVDDISTLRFMECYDIKNVIAVAA